MLRGVLSTKTGGVLAVQDFPILRLQKSCASIKVGAVSPRPSVRRSRLEDVLRRRCLTLCRQKSGERVRAVGRDFVRDRARLLHRVIVIAGVIIEGLLNNCGGSRHAVDDMRRRGAVIRGSGAWLQGSKQVRVVSPLCVVRCSVTEEALRRFLRSL